MSLRLFTCDFCPAEYATIERGLPPGWRGHLDNRHSCPSCAVSVPSVRITECLVPIIVECVPPPYQGTFTVGG